MNVHEGHRERLKERFLKEGLQGFQEHEVLELLLFYAIPRCDTNPIAHALIDRFGSISGVLDASIDELIKIKGIGKNSAMLLKLITPLNARYMESRFDPGQIVNSTEKAGQFFLPKFHGKTTEEVYLVSLDDKRKIIRCVCLSDQGIPNAVSIPIRQVVAEVVQTNATAVLMAHNHPGGLALPSHSDKIVTHKLHNALKLVNVQLVDHIIVADGDFTSMADSGLMDFP